MITFRKISSEFVVGFTLQQHVATQCCAYPYTRSLNTHLQIIIVTTVHILFVTKKHKRVTCLLITITNSSEASCFLVHGNRILDNTQHVYCNCNKITKISRCTGTFWHVFNTNIKINPLAAMGKHKQSLCSYVVKWNLHKKKFGRA